MPLALPQLFMLNWILETVGRTLYWISTLLLSFKSFVGNSTNGFRIRKFVSYVNRRWQMDVLATSFRLCCIQRAFSFRFWDPCTCGAMWYKALSYLELKSMSKAICIHTVSIVDYMIDTTKFGSGLFICQTWNVVSHSCVNETSLSPLLPLPNLIDICLYLFVTGQWFIFNSRVNCCLT